MHVTRYVVRDTVEEVCFLFALRRRRQSGPLTGLANQINHPTLGNEVPAAVEEASRGSGV